MSFSLRPHERLKGALGFSRARRRGTARSGRRLTAFFYRRDETPPRASRLGIIVRRRDGGAVARNLFKRRVREIFRLGKSRLGRGWDVVVQPRADASQPPRRFPAGYAELARDFAGLLPPAEE
jgi:ribonuclease P protein component